MDTGVIDENLVFTRDCLFASPSTAAVVRGANTNGRTVWKDASGRTLAMVEAMAIEE